jgi:hypothetical protein
LLGSDQHIVLERGFLADHDWKRVRERVESLLSGRFDLTVKPPPKQEFHVLRVLGVAVPLGLVTVLLTLSLLPFSWKSAAVFLTALYVLMNGILILCAFLKYQESERRNPSWRAAKSKLGDWEDWSF